MAFAGSSNRERLIATAVRLKLSFRSDISDEGLRCLIDAAPATDRQLLVLDDFLRPLKRDVPKNMTYGRARKAIEAALEVMNEQAVESLKLVEGAVRAWKDGYYYVIKVSGSSHRYKVKLRRVVLSRAQSAAKATVRPATNRDFTVNPINLLFVSSPVDLTTWTPASTFKPRVDPDEPLF